MLYQGRTCKKKRLTDPVKIIPFKGQKLRQKSPKRKSPKVTKNQTNLSEAIANKKARRLVTPTGNKGNSFLGINEELEKEKKANEIEKSKGDREKRESPFDYDQLKMAWTKYAHKIKDEGKHTLFTAMTTRDPKLMDDCIVKIRLNNNVQLSTIKENKSTIVTFLRNSLQNDNIQLKSEVLETKEKKIFTSKDKFEDMVKRNKNLEELKRRFRLDIDL